MSTINVASTLQTFSPKSKWEVSIDGKKIVMSGQEVDMIKKASVSGQRGIIWFKDFAISLPHISSIVLLDAGNAIDTFSPVEEISEEQRLKNLERIKKLKEELSRKI